MACKRFIVHSQLSFWADFPTALVQFTHFQRKSLDKEGSVSFYIKRMYILCPRGDIFFFFFLLSKEPLQGGPWSSSRNIEYIFIQIRRVVII